MKKNIIILISIILTSCFGPNKEPTVEEKIESFLKIQLDANWDNSNINVIFKSDEYIRPYTCFIKVNASYSEFIKLTERFDLKNESEITNDKTYISLDSFHLFDHVSPLISFTDSSMYTTVVAEKKAGKLNWWDISPNNKDTLKIGFIDNSHEHFVLSIKTSDKKYGTPGKMIARYKNGNVYIYVGELR